MASTRPASKQPFQISVRVDELAAAWSTAYRDLQDLCVCIPCPRQPGSQPHHPFRIKCKEPSFRQIKRNANHLSNRLEQRVCMYIACASFGGIPPSERPVFSLSGAQKLEMRYWRGNPQYHRLTVKHRGVDSLLSLNWMVYERDRMVARRQLSNRYYLPCCPILYHNRSILAR